MGCQEIKYYNKHTLSQEKTYLFTTDTNLYVMGDTYKQYINCNPKSDEIVKLVDEFSASKEHSTSFLMTKQENEHIIWSLGEILESEGLTLLIAPVIDTKNKGFTKTIFISKNKKYSKTKYAALTEQEKNLKKDINVYFEIKALHLSLGKDEHLDRHLVLSFPEATRNKKVRSILSDTLQIQIANVGDIWEKDYQSYLRRDYSVDSYQGKRVLFISGDYVYHHTSAGLLTFIKIPVNKRISIFNTD